MRHSARHRLGQEARASKQKGRPLRIDLLVSAGSPQSEEPNRLGALRAAAAGCKSNPADGRCCCQNTEKRSATAAAGRCYGSRGRWGSGRRWWWRGLIRRWWWRRWWLRKRFRSHRRWFRHHWLGRSGTRLGASARLHGFLRLWLRMMHRRGSVSKNHDRHSRHGNSRQHRNKRL
jgi:hypothetical protein